MSSPIALQQVFDVLPYPVFAKNSRHEWIYGNKAFEALMGVPDYLGKDDRAYFPPDQVKVFWTEDRRVFAGEESLNEEQIGQTLYALTRKVPIQLEDGTTGLVAIILASVATAETLDLAKDHYETLIKETGDQLERLRETSMRHALELEDRLSLAELRQQTAMDIAQTDATTGLKNRRGFETALNASIENHEDNHKRFGLGFIDIHSFKQINDQYGHATGDTVLTTVGRRLGELPDIYTVARWGGDEFAILTELPETNRAVMLQGLENARQYVFRPVRAGDRLIEISGSVGFSIYSEDAHSAEDLMRHADTALIIAKRRDHGNVQAFDQGIRNTLYRRQQLVRDLPDAITTGAIRPFYQPIICAMSRKVRGVEALSRWDHPELGPVSPVEFIEIAHECGLIRDLDSAVLTNACRDVAPWFNDGAIQYLSVNVSPMDIVSSDFAGRFLSSLKATGTDPKQVCLEIVESAIIGNLDVARINLHRLSAAGVMIALDDYGTGFSNMRALLDLPLDKLKIDQSLIRSIGSSNKIADLLKSIMQLANTLHVSVVAEGIETNLQSTFITSVGCDMMQGYLFSRPLSFSAMNSWLSTNRKRVA